MSQGGILADSTSAGADIETLTGNSGGSVGPDPVFNVNLLGGTGITVTGNPGTNTLTFDATGSAFDWNNVTGTSASMATDNGYVSNNAGLVTLTLPAVAAFGTSLAVSGVGAGGWKVAQNAGQQILMTGGATTVGAAGSVASTNRYDEIEMLCVIANTTWKIRSSVGILTFV